MTEIDPLEPRLIVPDVAFVPPTRNPSRLAHGNPVPASMAVVLLLVLAAIVGLGVFLDGILGGPPQPLDIVGGIGVATCHFVFWPRHRWWALLGALLGFVGGVLLLNGFLANAYSSDCGAAMAVLVYILVTHLPDGTASRTV